MKLLILSWTQSSHLENGGIKLLLTSECFEIIGWDDVNNVLGMVLFASKDTTHSGWVVRDATIIVVIVLLILIIDKIIWNLNKCVVCICIR